MDATLLEQRHSKNRSTVAVSRICVLCALSCSMECNKTAIRLKMVKESCVCPHAKIGMNILILSGALCHDLTLSSKLEIAC